MEGVDVVVSLGPSWDGASPEASGVLPEIWRFSQTCCGERWKEEDVDGVC